MLKYNIGDKYTVNGGSTAEIISLKGVLSKVQVRWLDEFQYEQYVNPKFLADGLVKNPFARSVKNFGYFGVGKYKASSHKRIYDIWYGMINRCYSEDYHENHISYEDCTVHPDWACFQTFAQWFEREKGSNLPGYQLDKDILLYGNKQYGPSACAFVPNYVNNFSSLRYIKNKEDLPAGVYISSRKISKSAPKYAASITSAKTNRKLHLGNYSTPMCAHAAWQKEKANQLYVIIGMYVNEPHFDTRVVDSLMDRAWRLLIDQHNGVETTQL